MGGSLISRHIDNFILDFISDQSCDWPGGCGANAPSSKRARRDSTSSSLSMEMPPLFSNGVVGQTTSQLVNRETELSLNSLLSRSQSMYQGSKLLYSSPTTGQQQQQLLHQRSQPFHTPCKRVSITQQQVLPQFSSVFSFLFFVVNKAYFVDQTQGVTL